uniref:Uncharacterized protein n=1 Tax=Anolis carolinensis TaxID=28377 RepID=A0A803TJX7_ANOCA
PFSSSEAERLFLAQNQLRLRAALHYPVSCLCKEVGKEKETQFRQIFFAKDLEMVARHAKWTMVNVKLLAKRSNSLLRYISQKSEEFALNNLKKEKKKKACSKKGRRTSDEQVESVVADCEKLNMAFP